MPLAPDRPSSYLIGMATRWTPSEYRQRPREYDPRLARQIVEMVENGESLVELCSEDRDLPLPGTFLRWCDDNPDLNREYRAACRRRSECMVDSMIDASMDVDPARGRNRIVVAQFHAERLNPKKYAKRTYMNADINAADEDSEGRRSDAAAELRRRVMNMRQRVGEVDGSEVAA